MPGTRDDGASPEGGAARRRGRVSTVSLVIVTTVVVSQLTAYATHRFGDVDDGSTHAAAIEWLVESGVTAGCGDGEDYCPGDAVTREQMASFLRGSRARIPASGRRWTRPPSRDGAQRTSPVPRDRRAERVRWDPPAPPVPWVPPAPSVRSVRRVRPVRWVRQARWGRGSSSGSAPR